MRTKTSPTSGFGIGSWRSCSGAVPTSAVCVRTIAFIGDCSQKNWPMVNRAQAGEHTTRCAQGRANEAAGESQREAYPLGYVEDCDESRTKLGAFFSSLLRFR